MSIACDTPDLIAGARCYECVPDKMIDALISYFMAVKAGGSVNAQTLLTAAAGYQVLQNNNLAVQVWILAGLAGVPQTVNGIVSLSQCGPCIPGEYKDRVNASIWQQASGVAFVPTATIPPLVIAFDVIGEMNAPVQTMLLNQISALNLSPQQLSQDSGCLNCLERGTLEDAYTALLCKWV